MSVLRLEQIRREIGDFVILDDVSGSVARGERVGLVGPNGAGKTTLLEIITGHEEPDGGRVIVAAGTTIGMLPQEANLDPVFGAAPEVRAAVRAGAAEVERLEAGLAALEERGAEAVESQVYAHLRERFERSTATTSTSAWTRRCPGSASRARTGRDRSRSCPAASRPAPRSRGCWWPIPSCSCSTSRPITWTSARSSGSRSRSSGGHGALIVASHDRAFLDAVVSRIWELRDRRLTPFRGAYSAYLAAARAGRRAAAQGRVRGCRRDRAREGARPALPLATQVLEDARARAAPRGSRRGAGGCATQAGPPRAPRHIPERRGPDALRRDGRHARGRDGRLSGCRRSPRDPDRVRQAARRDARRPRGHRRAERCGQDHAAAHDPGAAQPAGGFRPARGGRPAGLPRAVARSGHPGCDRARLAAGRVQRGHGPARSYLARFLFRGEDAFKPVSELSGGERSRLELALLGVTSANLLLLDEPTNHLDIPAREALETFLRDWPGTLLVVSHDRRLLETLCERLWVVEPGPRGGGAGEAVEFDGGYRAWRAAVADGWTVRGELEKTAHRFAQGPGGGHASGNGSKPASGRGAGGPAAPSTRPTSGRSSGQPRLSKDAYARQSRVVEDDLTRLGLRKSQLELALGDPRVQQNYVELRRLTSELADVDAALAQAEDAWLSLAERAPR